MGSLAKNAPSLDIGKWLPTNGLRLMSGEKPQARESVSDPKSDCAPVSAIADTSAVVDATAGPSQMRDIVFGTLGLSCKQVCFHFPLENMWNVGLVGGDLYSQSGILLFMSLVLNPLCELLGSGAAAAQNWQLGLPLRSVWW